MDVVKQKSVHKAAESKLAELSFRYTTARKRLVELLAKTDGPLTLPEILATDKKLAQSSAYRNLEVLVQCKIVDRISGIKEHAHYELSEFFTGHHHHLFCLSCGDVQDIEIDNCVEDTIASLFESVLKEKAFKPAGHTLDLHGYCASCI